MTRRVLLATACYKTLEPATAASREALLLEHHAADYQVTTSVIHTGYGAVRNVERIFDDALAVLPPRDGLLLYHDADMRFTVRDVSAMVEEHDRLDEEGYAPRIIGALYPSRHLRGITVGGGGRDPSRDGDLLAGRSAPCELLGFGFVTISVELLQRMKKPRCRETWDGIDGRSLDSCFCDDARAAGGDVRCMLLPVEHCCEDWRAFKP